MSENPTPPQSADSRFYTYVSIIAALFVFAGFARTYYLKGAYSTPELPKLVHMHGMVMTLWFALFIVQLLPFFSAGAAMTYTDG